MPDPHPPSESASGPFAPRADTRLAERDNHRGYETRDVNIRAVLWLAAGTAVGAVLVHVGLYYLLAWHEAQARRSDPELPQQTGRQTAPPGPSLQRAPLADYERYRREQERLTSTYGWVDRQQGIVRIPVERAMELYLERGPPPPAPPATSQSPQTEPQP